MQDANGLFHPDPVIILDGLKSIETGLKWTKLDGSPLDYTGEFGYAGGDIDYGFTAFSENQIHGNATDRYFRNNENFQKA